MPRRDPAWLDAEYNNRARVPEHPRHFARWAEASAQARRSLSPRLDVAYGAGGSETLDLFPAARADAPVLVFIHGGYWRSLDKSDVSFIAPPLVAAGAMVVLPNHALAPSVSLETIALQTARAVAWAWRHAALYGGDPGRLVVAGHSAGGHLAAMLCGCRWKDIDRDLPARLLHGAMSISGLHDLEPIRRTPFLQADLRLTPASVPRLSPAAWPSPPGARLFALVGADESSEFVRQNALIREAWGPRAVPVCETVPGADHFTVLDSLADPGSRTHALALELLGCSSG